MRNVIKRIANIVFVVVVLLLAAYTFLWQNIWRKQHRLPAIAYMLY